MPSYELHVENHHHDEFDHREVFDATDVQSAIRQALRVAAGIISEDLHRGRVGVNFDLCIDDEEGQRLRTMPVTVAVTGLAPVAR